MLGPVDLDALVRSYVPDGDASSHELALEVLGNGRPMWPRSELDPGHFTASAFVLSPDREEVLLVHHRKLDRWLQPGGHLESEDFSIEDGARREVLEETGVSDLRLLGPALMRIDAHQIPPFEDEPAHMHFDLGVGFHAGSHEIGPIAEVIEARWVRYSELQSFDVDGALTAGAQAVRRAAG
ncbi:MAG: NUDIX domain-containing protein [Actinomycetia bacterium]|nr:NUDIX domain-containing protein [Actinomycetes bacterium]